MKRTSLPVVASYDAFFLTHRRPHHPASKDTIDRWVKNVQQLSRVNFDIYKPHSYCSASTMQNLLGYPWKIFYGLASGNPLIASQSFMIG